MCFTEFTMHFSLLAVDTDLVSSAFSGGLLIHCKRLNVRMWLDTQVFEPVESKTLCGAPSNPQ